MNKAKLHCAQERARASRVAIMHTSAQKHAPADEVEKKRKKEIK
jgi:hypothetical protein